MFSTLESTWDHSARRRWTTFASFTFQAFALGSMLAISLIWVGRPLQVRWLQLSVPAPFTAQPSTTALGERGHHVNASVRRPEQIVAPPSIPLQTVRVTDEGRDASSVPSSSLPDLPMGNFGRGTSTSNVPGGLGSLPVVTPARPASVRPLLVSHLAEANLLHKVQPVYPSLARQARVEGAVELRAIIGKSGTIENLVVVRGHPMLATAAVEAVRQWRYRPYLLNNEPIEVETNITVNFVLSGG